MSSISKRKKGKSIKTEDFQIQNQKKMILQKLKQKGYRLTKQRIAIINIILENDCINCKEIFYKTAKINKKVGTATVYRTINMLEEIGAINRRNLYELSDLKEDAGTEIIRVMLENGGELQLTEGEWTEVLQMGLQACGYVKDEKIVSLVDSDAFEM